MSALVELSCLSCGSPALSSSGIVRFDREPLATPRIVSEELSQMHAADQLVMLRQRLPRRALVLRWGLRCRIRNHDHFPPAWATFLSTSLFRAMHATKSFQDLSKDWVPSRWSCTASAAS